MIRLETYAEISASSPTLYRTGPAPARRGRTLKSRSFGRRARRFIGPLAFVSMGVVVGACGMGHCGVRQSPAAAGPVTRVEVSTPVVAPAAKPVHARVITVRRGDTVWSVAERYGNPDSSMDENIERLLRSNHLDSSAVLQPGQKLRTIP